MLHLPVDLEEIGTSTRRSMVTRWSQKTARRAGLSPAMLYRACRRDEDDDVFIILKKNVKQYRLCYLLGQVNGLVWWAAIW
jgi:hypothetical protein